jgi:hypothetical protein
MREDMGIKERFLLRSSLPSPIAAIGLLREEEWLLDTTIR